MLGGRERDLEVITQRGKEGHCSGGDVVEWGRNFVKREYEESSIFPSY